MKPNKIKQILKKLKLINENSVKLYSTGTRDNKDIKVYKDEHTGIIFIDDYITEKKVYELGKYREDKKRISGDPSYERSIDLKRRLTNYQQFYLGRKVIDFGYGSGDFLRAVKSKSMQCCGVEVQKDYRENLKDNGINCLESLSELKNSLYDSAFAFHSVEHLNNPILFLKEIKKKLNKNGVAIIEVPHANDFLLNIIKHEAFKKFTLWSQHLILHTRLSLEIFLKEAGFSNIIIQGIQRYPLSNHLKWILENKPGGHKSIISSLDSDNLHLAYERALQKIDATDTLVAIAK
mgnify:CR=1 FL=1